MSSGRMDKYMDIDPYPISALKDRYGLKSKQSVYDRINGLGIKPVARGCISSDQLGLLDKLDKHIEAGGKIENFNRTDAELAHYFKTELNNHPAQIEKVSDPMCDRLFKLFQEIASALRPQVNPLQHLINLKQAELEGWLLSTSQVVELIGVKPHGNIYTRGSFAFVRSGKIGQQAAWRITKIPTDTQFQ